MSNTPTTVRTTNSSSLPLHSRLLTSLGCSYIKYPRCEEKIFSIVGRTTFRVQHINPKLVLHIHVLHHTNLYILAFVPLLQIFSYNCHLHIYLWCATSLFSMLISNPLRILQLNSATKTLVPSTKLCILQRNQGMLPITLLNSKHMLDPIMHCPAIILPRSTQ